jgi:hypothetical protein
VHALLTQLDAAFGNEHTALHEPQWLGLLGK